MKKKIDPNYVENFITDILNDIDKSFGLKKIKYKLNLETFSNRSLKLKYIDNEKLKIRESLNSIPNNRIRELENYRIYLNEKPLDSILRRRFITEELFIEYFDYSDQQLITFNSKNNEKLRKEAITKTLVENITYLEYNSFLKDEEIKIKEENLYQQKFVSKKLDWNGTKAELVELIKALIENGSLKAEKNNGKTEKKIYQSFEDFFGFEIKKPSTSLNDIFRRNNGSETLFLDKLKKSFLDYQIRMKNKKNKP